MVSDHPQADMEQQVCAVLQQLAAAIAPDQRLAVCEFRPRCDGRRVILRGTVSQRCLRERALEAVDGVPGVEEVDDWLTLLPTAEVAAWPWAVPKVPVIDLWRRPGAIGEFDLVDQELLGTPLRPLRLEGEWLQVQAPDGYLGWVPAATVALLDPAAVRLWEYGPWVLVIAAAGLRSEPAGAVLLQVPSGACLPLAADRGEWLALRWPGGGQVLLPATAGLVLATLPYPLRPGRATGNGGGPFPVPDRLLATARSLLEVPYRRGGAAPTGFDGAGLIRYVFARYGVALPRDADQQWAALHRLGADDDPLPGDLVFFGREGKPPGDVGLYTGDGHCLHAGPSGVQEVSFHPGESAFDPGLAAAAVGYGRILPPQGMWGEGI